MIWIDKKYSLSNKCPSLSNIKRLRIYEGLTFSYEWRKLQASDKYVCVNRYTGRYYCVLMIDWRWLLVRWLVYKLREDIIALTTAAGRRKYTISRHWYEWKIKLIRIFCSETQLKLRRIATRDFTTILNSPQSYIYLRR